MKTTADATKPAAELFFDERSAAMACAAEAHDIAVLPLQGGDAKRALVLVGGAWMRKDL
jgi:hypothetical protein